ncbi:MULTISPECIES: branched-chain amino acid ABC transporter permease [Halorussus]|uniref:branched-chain amino acid ABC transporter permease n=1 Tax=Halorussus TaxID=1070314 RepID=UPI000E21B033|nr:MULTISPECIES: branched-chain amino acid ABC transporter permease [Halorussus]NHN57656.1 branched-chain amino acid ABC transporter permease [Halorussus sp. JP-T4]
MSYTDTVRERVRDGDLAVVVAGVVVLALLAGAPLYLGPVETSLLITVLLVAIFGTAFNLLYGYTGLLSFGHAMFLAVAAYATAKVFNVVGPLLGLEELFGGASVLATFALAVLVGVGFATLLAVPIGYLSVQLEEIYFAMITLSFSMAVFVMLLQDITGQLADLLGLGETATELLVTNGDDGLIVSYQAMGEVDLFGWAFTFMNISDYLAFYFVVLSAFVGSMYALWRVVRSPFGRVCLAIRENPERARSLGIDVTRHSWATFVVSAAFTGLVGTMWAPLQSSVVPGIGHWTFSATPVLVTVIGGPYSFLGPTVGSFVYEYIRFTIDQYPALAARWQLVFGVILLSVVMFFENGVTGGIRSLWERARGELSSGDAAPAEGRGDREQG